MNLTRTLTELRAVLNTSTDTSGVQFATMSSTTTTMPLQSSAAQLACHHQELKSFHTMEATTTIWDKAPLSWTM
jgi:hypothetical protein